MIRFAPQAGGWRCRNTTRFLRGAPVLCEVRDGQSGCGFRRESPVATRRLQFSPPTAPVTPPTTWPTVSVTPPSGGLPTRGGPVGPGPTGPVGGAIEAQMSSTNRLAASTGAAFEHCPLGTPTTPIDSALMMGQQAPARESRRVIRRPSRWVGRSSVLPCRPSAPRPRGRVESTADVIVLVGLRQAWLTRPAPIRHGGNAASEGDSRPYRPDFLKRTKKSPLCDNTSRELLHSRSRLRSTQLIQGDAQRSAGNFDQPTIRLIRFEHHKDRGGKCKRRNEQCGYHAGIARREEPETGEDNR